MGTLLIAMAAAAVASAAVTRLIRDYSRRRHLLDVPGSRSSHSVPTPRLGGVAIAFVSLAAWLALGQLRGEGGSFAIVVFLSGGLAAIVGLIDDLRGLSPAPKLAGQCVALLPVIAAGPPYGALSLSPWAILALECAWIVGYTNIFNFMDGSDGLAGETAAVTAVSLWLVAWLGHVPGMAWPLLLVGAASTGFLRYNWPPASIFMGDSGSLFLGTALSLVAVGLIRAGARPEAVAVVFTPFLFDGLFTLARRTSRGEPVWRAHRSHLYQRLLIAGKSHAWVARLYLAWGLASGGAGALCSRAGGGVLAAAIFAGATGGLLIVLVRRIERGARRAGAGVSVEG